MNNPPAILVTDHLIERPAARHLRRQVRSLLFYLLVLAIGAPFLFVFLWMVLASFKTQVQNTAYPPVLIFTPTLENYKTVLLRNPFPQFTVNSLVVAVGSTMLGLVLGLPAAYSVARFRQTGLALGILAARMAPGISYLIPWFILFTKLGLVDTYLALILTHLTVGLPLILWTMIGFFEDIPREVEEAALVDGCSIFGTFWRIALPLTRPGIAAAAILSFIFSWNNFLFSVILSGSQTRTLPVAVFNFMSYEEINWGGLTAAATLITLPVLVLVLFVQREIVRGLTLGAIKG